MKYIDKRGNQKEQVSILMDENIKLTLDKISQEKDISVSKVGELFIKQGIDKLQDRHIFL